VRKNLTPFIVDHLLRFLISSLPLASLPPVLLPLSLPLVFFLLFLWPFVSPFFFCEAK
jgi:hypothetical protein